MIEMGVGKKQIRVDGTFMGTLQHQMLPQGPQPGTTVKNYQMRAAAHFEAGCISAISRVIGTRTGQRSAYAPKA